MESITERARDVTKGEEERKLKGLRMGEKRVKKKQRRKGEGKG